MTDNFASHDWPTAFNWRRRRAPKYRAIVAPIMINISGTLRARSQIESRHTSNRERFDTGWALSAVAYSDAPKRSRRMNYRSDGLISLE